MLPVIADALEHDWGGEAHDGGVAGAAAVGPFGKGSILRHLRVDRFVPVREQIAGLRAGLAKGPRRRAELADEVARSGANDSRRVGEPDGAKREKDRWRTMS
jgi:hypothetical protein